MMRPRRYSHWMVGTAFVLCLSFLCPGVSYAQEAEHDEEHHFHANHVGVLLGAATPKKAKSETSFALGIDYERRLNDWVGVGALVDFVLGDFKRTALVGGAVFIHPIGDLSILAAPGAEWVEKEALRRGGAGQKNEPFFVIRLGVSYPFHLGNASIAPVLNVDFIGESKTTFVYGVTFGYAF